jgi:hypothetical protein
VLPLQADISVKKLPSVGNLAVMIGKANQADVEKTVYNKAGKISAGLSVPDSSRGRTAEELAGYLSNNSEELRKQLYDAFSTERASFETYLTNANFDTKDMGVAYAACFIVLWELASHKELPQEGSLQAGKFLVHSFRGIGDQYASISDTEKADAYDWLMTTPVVYGSLIKSFDKESRSKEAEMLREHAGQLFSETFKFTHDMITISDKGEFGVDEDRIMAYQKQQGVSAAPRAKDTLTSQNHPVIPVFKKLSGIKGIAIISNIGLDVFSRSYKLKSRNILLFENGDFSKDLETILEKGIAYSQNNHPDKWGKFKISNRKLSLKYNHKNQYDIQKYFTLYPPNPVNKKLSGCWSSSKTFELSNGVSTGSGMGISGYCFDNNGRFYKNNTFGFSGGIDNSPYGKAIKLPVGSYSSASEKSQLGWYRIDEYTIQLHYDDGTKETKILGIDDMLLLGYSQLFIVE